MIRIPPEGLQNALAVVSARRRPHLGVSTVYDPSDLGEAGRGIRVVPPEFDCGVKAVDRFKRTRTNKAISAGHNSAAEKILCAPKREGIDVCAHETGAHLEKRARIIEIVRPRNRNNGRVLEITYALLKPPFGRNGVRVKKCENLSGRRKASPFTRALNA